MRRLLPAVLAACALLAPASALASGTPQPRIVGGTTAAPGAWPSIVALEDTTRTAGANPDYNQQICGGTLITAQWVLTAQHCTVDEQNGTPTPLADLEVVYGSQRLDGSGTRVAITQIVPAPGYSTTTYANDLALLRLATPVANASTLPVTVPALSALWAPGTLSSVAGWGDLRENGGDYPIDLQTLTALPIVSDSDCQTAYPALVPAVMVCAGDLANGGIDTCDGDSGGPLVVHDAAGHPVLIGDTSYGSGCAEAGLPGVYGEIAGMRALIDQTLGWTTAATISGDGVVGSGNTRTVTLTSTGSAPLSVSGVALSGTGAGAFAVAQDGCTNVVLTAGQSCAVDIRQTAADAGQVATLALTGDGAAGTKSAQLSAPAATTGDPGPGTGTGTTPTATQPPATTRTTPTVATETPQQQPAPRRPVAKLPKVTLAALSGHRVKVTATGPGTVRLTFSREVRHGRRTVRQTLATATVKFTNKGSKTITLRLTAAGRAALAHGRHVRAASVIEVKVTGAGSGRTGSLTLR